MEQWIEKIANEAYEDEIEKIRQAVIKDAKGGMHIEDDGNTFKPGLLSNSEIIDYEDKGSIPGALTATSGAILGMLAGLGHASQKTKNPYLKVLALLGGGTVGALPGLAVKKGLQAHWLNNKADEIIAQRDRNKILAGM